MRRLIAGLALVAGVLAPATSASAAMLKAPEQVDPGVGIRLLEAPVATADDPRARIYIVDHVAPGTLVERRIEISNGTQEESDVSLYAGAASIIDGGGFAVEAEGASNELTQWMSILPEQPAIAPGERQEATVKIAVPSDATQGEHYGVIWAQVSTTPESGGITQVSRVGIRVYLSVGPGGAPPSDFTISELVAERTPGGQPVVQAKIHNTGQRALDLSAEMTLSDGPGGLSAGPFPTGVGSTVGVGDSAPVLIELDPRLPNGPWRARLTVKSGVEERSTEATLTFPEAGQSVAADIATPIPWALVASATALVIAVALLVTVAARRKRSRSSVSDAAETQLLPV